MLPSSAALGGLARFIQATTQQKPIAGSPRDLYQHCTSHTSFLGIPLEVAEGWMESEAAKRATRWPEGVLRELRDQGRRRKAPVASRGLDCFGRKKQKGRNESKPGLTEGKQPPSPPTESFSVGGRWRRSWMVDGPRPRPRPRPPPPSSALALCLGTRRSEDAI